MFKRPALTSMLASRAGTPRPELAAAMEREFGKDWERHLPERLLEAVWDGDARAVDSDARRFARLLPRVEAPSVEQRISVEFLTALYTAANRWTRVRAGADPSSDRDRLHEVVALLTERTLLRSGQTSDTARVSRHSKASDPLSGPWIDRVADLVVRSVRFRDGFTAPELARNLALVGHAETESYEQSLVRVARSAGRIVNGVSEGSKTGEDIMARIRRRFGGEYPLAAAVQAAMIAIRQGDGEALRELADLTAGAADDMHSPARVLHNLVLAGEKVLHARV